MPVSYTQLADDLAAGKHVQSTEDLDAVEAELESVPAEETPAVAAPEKPYGFLAVCAGDGPAAVFRDLGACLLYTSVQRGVLHIGEAP